MQTVAGSVLGCILLIPILIKAQSATNKICTSSPCNIDCNELDWTYSCQSIIIDGRNSTSLSLTCRDEACKKASIYCSEYCSIHCIGQYSCQQTHVYYDDSDNINKPPNITVTCEEERSCSEMYIQSLDIHYGNITQNNNKPNGGILNVFSGYYPNIARIYGNRMDEVNIWCTQYRSCLNSYFFMYQVNQFNMYCSSNSISSNSPTSTNAPYQYCTNLHLYCPSNSSDACNLINCHCETGGDYNEIYVYNSLITTGNKQIFYNFLNAESYSVPWKVTCDYLIYGHYHTYPHHYKPNEPRPVTSMAIWNQEISRYECSNLYCCPFKRYIEYHCDNIHKECGILCDNCYKKQIDGGNFTDSLYVTCPSQLNGNKQGSCTNATIYCPTQSNSLCSVHCESYGCRDTVIFSTPHASNKIIVNCKDSHSCDNVEIVGDYAAEISVYCAKTGQDGAPSCNSMTINAQHITNKVEFYCIGNHSCNSTNIFAEYANNITLYADGYQSMYFGLIYAIHANELSVSCKNYVSINDLPTTGGTGGCYFTSLYIPTPTLSKFNLECIGTGCYYLKLYTQRVEFTNKMDINIYSCSQCDSISNCIDHWTIYCDINSSNTLTSTAFWGDHCTSISDCNCQEFADISSFISSDTHPYCSKSITTTTTTLPPSVMIPSPAVGKPTSVPSYSWSRFPTIPYSTEQIVSTTPSYMTTFVSNTWPSKQFASPTSVPITASKRSESDIINKDVMYICIVGIMALIIIGLVIFIIYRQRKLKSQFSQLTENMT